MMASSSSSSEFTADELEAAEALIKLKTTDPDSTLSDFFPRWLQKKKRLLPYDEKSSERGKRLSPDTPLDVPRSPIAGDKNPFSRLPPLLSCSKMESLKKNDDEKQAELVNKKKEQMMNAVSPTQRFRSSGKTSNGRYLSKADLRKDARRMRNGPGRNCMGARVEISKGYMPNSFDQVLLDAPCSALGLRPRLFAGEAILTSQYRKSTTASRLHLIVFLRNVLSACVDPTGKIPFTPLGHPPPATGQSQVIEVDKFTMMRRCDLPARDLRLLDPLFVYPSTILGREKAIVVNLEQIRCIITADEVLLLNSLDGCFGVLNAMSYSLYIFPVLYCRAAELEIEAYPLLDELTSKISTLNLERVRRLKSRLVALTRRVQKVRDEIEQLMDDDGDMAEMYLTEKKRRMESFFGDQSLQGYSSTGPGVSVSAPVSPVSSPPESRRLEKALSFARSRHSSMKSSDSTKENIEELEMLLEAYFVVIDSTLNKLTSLKEYIDDTEDFINIQLDNVRNQLIQFELILTTATFIVTIFSVVAGIFGMNFEIPLFNDPSAFDWVLIITGTCGAIIFCCFLFYFKWMGLIMVKFRHDGHFDFLHNDGYIGGRADVDIQAEADIA
ncbi:uncharacterized protein A4U43_C05F17450 [Asparagus officinalis]|uniref:Magnesium transporter n=1 Tax=Asparagus officinalis TaxID=4686 RepID=A0A5P1ESZ2_ASPOF|nr:uncharacterized protein A4U43_C05F17450 [Asparagus officinalis]